MLYNYGSPGRRLHKGHGSSLTPYSVLVTQGTDVGLRWVLQTGPVVGVGVVENKNEARLREEDGEGKEKRT